MLKTLFSVSLFAFGFSPISFAHEYESSMHDILIAQQREQKPQKTQKSSVTKAKRKSKTPKKKEISIQPPPVEVEPPFGDDDAVDAIPAAKGIGMGFGS
jgi:hypothetical protein